MAIWDTLFNRRMAPQPPASIQRGFGPQIGTSSGSYNPAQPATQNMSFADRIFGPHMLPIAGALMSGRPEALGRGFTAAGLIQQDEADRRREAQQRQAAINATAQYLEKDNPQAAEAIRAGAPAGPIMADLARGQKTTKPSAFGEQWNFYKSAYGDTPDSRKKFMESYGKRGNTTVNIGTDDEGRIGANPAKAVGDADKAILKDADEKAAGVDEMMIQLDAAENILDSGYQTGAFGTAQGEAARYSAALGGPGQQTAESYENLSAISKRIGIEGLKAMGGSDTERELLTSIQTTVSPDKTMGANKAILARQKKAFEIVGARPDFMREWIRNNGTLANPSAGFVIHGVSIEPGTTFQQAWRQYQLGRFGNEAPQIPQDAPSSPADVLGGSGWQDFDGGRIRQVSP